MLHRWTIVFYMFCLKINKTEEDSFSPKGYTFEFHKREIRHYENQNKRVYYNVQCTDDLRKCEQYKNVMIVQFRFSYLNQFKFK